VKWIALALLLIAIPAMAAWLRSRPPQVHFLWGLLGFLPFVLEPWHLMVTPYATPLWSGYVKGWQFTLLDAIAVSILIGMRGRWPKLVLLVPFLLYILAATIAVAQAKFPNLAWSYIIQLLRGLLVYLAVARVATSERGERAIFTGMVAGLAVQALYAIWARAGGALQTGGTLGHQNLLGFVSYMVVMPSFALLLAGRWKWIAAVGLLAGTCAVILTASRATIVLSAFGLMLTLFLSTAFHRTSRKLAVGFASALLVAASIPLANATLQRRFEAQKSTFFTEDMERVAFARAARLMISEHPMGVGPNFYVFISNTEGYAARGGVNWSIGNRSANVHNSYLLVAAETGILGALAFGLLIAASIYRAMATAFRFRRNRESDICVGIVCGFIAMSAHALYEWMYVVNPTQYLFAISLGLIAGLRSRLVQSASSKVRPFADTVVGQPLQHPLRDARGSA